MTPTNLVSPLIGEFGLGGVGGFCVGYSMKKLAKIVTAILALCFLGLQYLVSVGVISLDYLALEKWAISMFGGTSALQGYFITLLAQMPFGVGFTGGSSRSKKRVIKQARVVAH